MSTYRNLMTVCAAVVLAFGLAACGSSDDDTAATDTPTVEEPAGPTQAELDAEKARADAAEKALADKAAADATAKSVGLFKAIRANVNGTGTEESGDPAMDAAYNPKPKVKASDSRAHDDKGADTTMAFSKYYAGRLTGDDGGPATGDILNLQGAETAGGPGENMPELGAASDGFPKNGGSVVYTDAVAGLLPASVLLPGTLMGAKGNYECVMDACEISEDGGKYTFSEGWTFDPDSGAEVTIEDDDYSRWGWWAFERKDGTFRVETYAVATSAMDDIATAPGDLLGSATYMGSAAGKYAIDNRPTGDTLEAAHFDASATIVADLTGLTASGTIDNFMVDGAERDWSVSLGRTNIVWANANDETTPTRDIISSDDEVVAADPTATPAVVAVAAGGFKNVWTIGGVKGAAAGDWEADFHHDGDQRNDQTPAVVIGQFTASHGTNAYMTGAFGARNMAADTPE